jgi:hypothetical protein
MKGIGGAFLFGSDRTQGLAAAPAPVSRGAARLDLRPRGDDFLGALRKSRSTAIRARKSKGVLVQDLRATRP